MAKKRVGIVIVNYNGLSYQSDCFRTLHEMTTDDFVVILVDSASTDGSVEVIEREYPETVVVRCDTNVGVAAGNNIGIKKSIELGCEYTLLSNNDVEVDKHLLERLLGAADARTIAVPKIYYYEPHNLLWYAGGELDWGKGAARHFGIDENDEGHYNQPLKVTYSPTCCMLIHNSIFDAVGLMDENYFMYFDDTDFCARVFMDDELSILYVPTATLWHKVSSSTGGPRSKLQNYYIARNQFYYFDKFSQFLTSSKAVQKARLRYRLKYMRGLVKRTNEVVIGKALRDYRKGDMGRCDSL